MVWGHTLSAPGSGRARLTEVNSGATPLELLRDAGGRHRRELRLDVVGEHHQVADLPGAVADVVGQQRLRLEAQCPEHADQRRLVGDHLDHQLGEPEVHGVHHRLPCEAAPDPATAVLRVDDQSDLPDMTGPSVQRHDCNGPDDLAGVHGDHPRGSRTRPGGDHFRVVDVLFEEGTVGVGDAREEARERRLVSWLDRSELHQGSSGPGRSSECAMIHSARRGIVCLSALRPVPNVTWPPGSLSSSRRAESPTIWMIGSTAAGGTTLSPSAMALSTVPRAFSRCTSRPPTEIVPVISTFLRTNSSTSVPNIAPGNGTWSRAHSAIAWNPSTNLSFQRFSGKVAFCATSVVGACM